MLYSSGNCGLMHIVVMIVLCHNVIVPQLGRMLAPIRAAFIQQLIVGFGAATVHGLLTCMALSQTSLDILDYRSLIYWKYSGCSAGGNYLLDIPLHVSH